MSSEILTVGPKTRKDWKSLQKETVMPVLHQIYKSLKKIYKWIN